MRYVLIFAVLLLLSCGGSVGGSYERPSPTATVLDWRGFGGFLGGDGFFVADVQIINKEKYIIENFSLVVRAYNREGGMMSAENFTFQQTIEGFGSAVVNCRLPLKGRKRDVYRMEAIVTSW